MRCAPVTPSTRSLPGLHVRADDDIRGEHHVRFARQHGERRLCAALVGDVLHVDLRLQHEVRCP